MAGEDPTSLASAAAVCSSAGADRSAITADPAAADFVLLSGINADAEPAAERTRALAGARARRLPLVCTNPDLIGLDGEPRIDAPGTVARRYAEAGGEVRDVGKPWPAIYRAALATMAMRASASSRSATPSSTTSRARPASASTAP